MKHSKLNHMLIALLFSGVAAFATSKQSNLLDLCTTVPATWGPGINAECPYSPSVQCCYIAAGSSSEFVTQSQGGALVTIRRNPSQVVTIFGVRD
jgi:hypothetical protein